MVVIDILLAGAVTYAALSSERGVLIALVAACVCLVCWQVAVFLRARRGALALGIERNIRLPHYLQAGVQACHYLYLGLYYPAVQEHLPLIAIQIVVFYAMEMLLQWSRGRNWRAGFGPLPVVGSINLFLWFEPEYFVGQLLLVAGALASREFVRWRRNGRSSHIFNPSAIALAAAAATTGINHILAFELPPSFFELMFVCGILLQIFFATTLVTFGAVLTFALIHYGGTPAPGRMAAVQRVPHQRLPGPEPAGHGPGDLAQVADGQVPVRGDVGSGHLVLLRRAALPGSSALLRQDPHGPVGEPARACLRESRPGAGGVVPVRPGGLSSLPTPGCSCSSCRR